MKQVEKVFIVHIYTSSLSLVSLANCSSRLASSSVCWAAASCISNLSNSSVSNSRRLAVGEDNQCEILNCNEYNVKQECHKEPQMLACYKIQVFTYDNATNGDNTVITRPQSFFSSRRK